MNTSPLQELLNTCADAVAIHYSACALNMNARKNCITTNVRVHASSIGQKNSQRDRSACLLPEFYGPDEYAQRFANRITHEFDTAFVNSYKKRTLVRSTGA